MPTNEKKNSVKPQMTTKNKTNDLCITHLKTKWRTILTTRFAYFFNTSPESSQRMALIMDSMIKTLESIFLKFSDLKDTQFNTQVMFPGEAAYAQRMAEMLFYYQLLKMGFDDIKSKDAGPDFVAEKNGETFCFEVVTPTPQDSVQELIGRRELAPDERDLVFRERLLSVTSTIKDKLEQFEAHKSAGHVPAGAHYIIVVNDSLLLPYNEPWYGAIAELCFGESTLPIVADATLGSGSIDFTKILGETASEKNGDELQTLVVRSSLGISFNGGKPVIEEHHLIPVRSRKTIPTRNDTDTIVVDIAESVGTAGIYQITLREDLMFFHSFESSQTIMPRSALISSTRNKQPVRNAIFFSSTYAKDEDLVQPIMSPAPILGHKPQDFNNQAIYNVFFKPYLEGGEFYKSPDSQD